MVNNGCLSTPRKVYLVLHLEPNRLKADDGLGILNHAVLDEIHGLGKRHFNDLQDFIRTQILRARGEVSPHKNVNDFVGKARRGEKTQDRLQPADLVAGFFFHFPNRAIPGVFTGMQLARGDFIDEASDGMTILPDHDHRSVVFHRHDGRSPGMGDDLKVGRGPRSAGSPSPRTDR